MDTQLTMPEERPTTARGTVRAVVMHWGSPEPGGSATGTSSHEPPSSVSSSSSPPPLEGGPAEGGARRLHVTPASLIDSSCCPSHVHAHDVASSSWWVMHWPLSSSAMLPSWGAPAQSVTFLHCLKHVLPHSTASRSHLRLMMRENRRRHHPKRSSTRSLRERCCNCPCCCRRPTRTVQRMRRRRCCGGGDLKVDDEEFKSMIEKVCVPLSCRRQTQQRAWSHRVTTTNSWHLRDRRRERACRWAVGNRT